MKVYAIVYDCEGYEEKVEKLFSSKEKAFKYWRDGNNYSEETLISWELDTQKRKIIEHGTL